MITFSLPASLLFSRVSKIAKLVSSKNSLPILDNIMFELNDSSLTLTAADAEGQVQTVIQGLFGYTGIFCLNAKMLVESLKELSGYDSVTFNVDMDRYTAVIQYKNGKFSLPVVNASDFPQLAVVNETAVNQVPADTLRKIIRKSANFITPDELRPQMGGICFNFTDKIETCASNGHVLIRTSSAMEVAHKGLFVLSQRACSLVAGFMTDDESNVGFCFDGRNLRVSMKDYTYTTRLIEGRYPNYNSVIPNNYKNTIEVDRQSFQSVLKRVMVFADTAACLVKIDAKGNNLVLSAQDIDFSMAAEESMECTKNGEDITAGLKGIFLMNVVGALTGEMLNISYISNMAAFRFDETEENGFQITCILMPMMLND